MQFTENKFREQHEITIGVEFESKTVDINGKIIKIQVWDTAGHEAFQSITRSYYKGAVGALLVYDITRRDTFNHIVKWLNEIKENGSKDITIVLIGNKNDLENERQISYDEGESFAEKNGLLFFETSAKTSSKIAEAFNTSALKILNNIQNLGKDPNLNNGIKINNEKEILSRKNLKNSKNKKKGCC